MSNPEGPGEFSERDQDSGSVFGSLLGNIQGGNGWKKARVRWRPGKGIKEVMSALSL